MTVAAGPWVGRMGGRIRTRAASLANAALDAVLPPSCPACAARTDAPGLLCGPCFARLETIGAPCCACCGAPFELAWHDHEGGLCAKCAETPPPFERARAALRYGETARRLVLPFKHGDRTDIARLLARLMARAGGALLHDADVLIPVPVHRRRLFKRRYNQAALLAQELGRISGRTVLVDALARVHHTASMGFKSVSERHEEVAGAFAVRHRLVDSLRDRRVLLIDDVMTSGATATECATELLDAGVAAVDVLVAARVPDPRPKRRRKRRHFEFQASSAA